MTNNIKRRIKEHKEKMNEGFSKRYGLNIPVYYEVFKYVNDAYKKEKQLKKWKREWKIRLIEESNPKWKDLSSTWHD